MLANDVLHTIGNTPHIRINRLFGSSHNVYVKSERANPGGSIKDRIAVAMVEAAEAAGALKPGATIVEPTSGNTGVGLAMVAAVKGYRLLLVMPDSMSVERRRLMLAYGATFELTPREKGMKGAIARADEIVAELNRSSPGAWMPQQFENPANVDIHVRTTAQEIAADFPSGIEALITGVGTGGHITGCAQVLKKMWPKLKVFAVEPSASPVISGGAPSPHPIQGIGAGFIPKNLNVELLDGTIQVEAEAAREMARRSAREEGLLVGISSGATLAAIAQKLAEFPPGSTVLGFNYDTGERYLSIEGFLPHGMKPRILIVEDEPGIADTLQYALRTDGFEPAWCATGEEALAHARDQPPALVILDVGLPDASGFEIFKRLRAVSDVPVVFLTARSDEIDRVVGLELGADDYIAKPFSPRELVARVRGVLRRSARGGGGEAAAAAAVAGQPPIAVDEGRMQIRYYGRLLELSRYEFGLLKTLASRPGHVYSRDALLERVWGNDSDSMDRTVDAHVKTLRAKMKAIAPHQEPIRTLRGSGYALEEDLPANPSVA